MENSIILGVYRRLDNRMQGLPDDSEMALQLHNLRRAALHEVFEQQTVAQIIDWGDTDDTRSHEYVELILSALSAAVMQPIFIKGIKELGKKLAEKAVDETTSEFVKWIISKLTKKQKEQKVADFSIALKDGTLIRVDPPQGTSEITVRFKDGELSSIKYEIDNN